MLQARKKWKNCGWFFFLVWSAAVLLLDACGKAGGGGTEVAKKPSAPTAQSASPFPLFLFPLREVPRAGMAFQVDLRAGEIPPGKFIPWSSLEMDSFFARQGGNQWYLEPGEPVKFPRPGEVLLGLLSRPAAVPGVRGKVVYCSKTLLQVSPSPGGASRAAPSSVTAEAGLPLEIVPLADPAGLRPGDDCPLQAVFRGDPLAGAEIRVEGECRGWGNPILLKTGAEGGACFRLEGAGSWLITVHRVGVSSSGEPATWVSSLFFEAKGGKR